MTVQKRTLKLPDQFIKTLVSLPETGMGYQIVNVVLKNGAILHKHKVINSSFLMLEENDKLTQKDIEKIEMS